MSRSYRHIQVYEKKMHELKEQGKLAVEMLLKKRGRLPKSHAVSVADVNMFSAKLRCAFWFFPVVTYALVISRLPYLLY